MEIPPRPPAGPTDRRTRASRPPRSAARTPRSLAELARTALSHATGAGLQVVGLAPLVGDAGASGVTDIDLVERDGIPTFPCAADSRLRSAVGSEARLVVRDERGHPARVTVVLTGRLALDDAGTPGPAARCVVALLVSAVVVEYDDPSSPTVVQRTIAVEDYLAVAVGPVEAAAVALMHHLTVCHQEELRRYAAVVADCAYDDIAGAALTDLHAAGVRLGWVDLDGGGVVELPFGRVAQSPDDLAELLRQRLVGFGSG